MNADKVEFYVVAWIWWFAILGLVFVFVVAMVTPSGQTRARWVISAIVVAAVLAAGISGTTDYLQ